MTLHNALHPRYRYDGPSSNPRRVCFHFTSRQYSWEMYESNYSSTSFGQNRRANWDLKPWYSNRSRRKTINSKPVKPCLKIDLVPYYARAEGLGKYIHPRGDGRFCFHFWQIFKYYSYMRGRFIYSHDFVNESSLFHFLSILLFKYFKPAHQHCRQSDCQ